MPLLLPGDASSEHTASKGLAEPLVPVLEEYLEQVMLGSLDDHSHLRTH